MKQRTIGKEFRVTGMGLHTGRKVTVTVRPAPPDSGIAFRRTDRFNIVTQKALAENVSETKRGTTLGSGRHSVATIEHLMSALHGCEVDNVLVELDGGEVPILDGSARPWMMQLTRVGTVEQPAERRVGKVTEKLHFEHPSTGSVYEVEPADGFSVECVIDFPGSVIGRQSAKIESLNEYAAGIAPCRTFVFLHEKLTGMYLIALAVMAAGTALVVADTLIRSHTHPHQHIYTHTHGGVTHTHTVTHTHDHHHYIHDDVHGHHHSIKELEHTP